MKKHINSSTIVVKDLSMDLSLLDGSIMLKLNKDIVTLMEEMEESYIVYTYWIL